MRGGCLNPTCQTIILNPKEIPKKERFLTERIKGILRKRLGEEELSFGLLFLRKIPEFLRKEEPFKVVLLKEGGGLKIVDCVRMEEPVLGMAIDLGSTTIAFYLYDFEKQSLLEEYSILNPQVKYGEDILTRLHLARSKEKLLELREITLASLNQELQSKGGNSIYFVSLCGNTAMTHFFLGLPIMDLLVEPYVPVANWFDIFSSKEVGLLINEGGRIFIFPSAGAYFGGDLIAGLFYLELSKKENPCFLIDIGTNAEVVLGNKDFLLACAGAAGPALEGGVFKSGCRAEEGAIHQISIHPSQRKLEFATLGGAKPKCLCGSAIIDLLAQLFKFGILSPDGKLKKELWPERIIEVEEGLAFIIYQDPQITLAITEPEIKSFLRSKGAAFSMLSLLCEKVGLDFSAIEKFYFAGSFGVNINVNSAVTLGMLPEVALKKAEAVGNSAGLGALKLLIQWQIEEVKNILHSITYLELNNEPRFMELLTGAMFIPHVNLELFPQVKRIFKI